MEEREKYLPIGSVVLLEEDTKKLMITGFCSSASDDEQKEYDYSGCAYPEGLISTEEIYLFDHNQIEEICFVGYESEEEQEFKTALKETLLEEDSLTNDNSETINQTIGIANYDRL